MQYPTLDTERISPTELRFRRSIAATPARLYAAHIEPVLVRGWLGAMMPLTTCTIDPRPGGDFRYVWTGEDGQQMGMSGHFVALEPGVRSIHTELFDEDWTDGETTVETHFRPEGEGCLLDMTVRYRTPEGVEMALNSGMVEGMAQGYDTLAALFTAEDTPIVVACHTTASLERAWQAYTTPDAIMRWNAASDDWHCPEARNDLRPGGAFCYRMAARDGSFAFDYEGTWEVVEAPHRLVQQFAGRHVWIRFAPTEVGTLVTVTFDPDGQASRELQEAGWQAILNRFAAVAATP